MVDFRRPDYDTPRVLRHVDLMLPVLALVTAGIGVLMVYSATRGPATDLRPAETFFLGRQCGWWALGQQRWPWPPGSGTGDSSG
ncbi:MAG: hypothetical protein CM1200mP26_20300 [Acidimicrobiales bacterium]|nr:MAG: hypothetical protein CM1200mP26_20300 [Acidimicrobiales bacterium]